MIGGGAARRAARRPARITELAEAESDAQPTTTLLVKRLEERGLVTRERDPGDGRAVLVSLTEAGARALDEFRAGCRAVMREQLAAMSDDAITPCTPPPRRSASSTRPSAGRTPDELAPRTPARRPAASSVSKAVWAVAFAAVVSFMGLGLVDPILPAIARDLDASPSQVSLPFTSYFAFTGILDARRERRGHPHRRLAHAHRRARPHHRLQRPRRRLGRHRRSPSGNGLYASSVKKPKL